MKITDALVELIEKVGSLGIPEYFDGLDDDEIIILGLHFYGEYIEANLDNIKKDMEGD